MNRQEFAWLDLPAVDAARRLLGCELLSRVDGELVRAKIVETEAYDELDEASHAFGGERPGNKTMYMAAGHLYVYQIYGMYYCCNVVCGRAGFGSGVLVRAVEPLDGLDIIARRRARIEKYATNGPSKLCIALGIDRTMDGHDLSHEPLRLLQRPMIGSEEIIMTTRIGITKASEELKRFYVRDSDYVSIKVKGDVQ